MKIIKFFKKFDALEATICVGVVLILMMLSFLFGAYLTNETYYRVIGGIRVKEIVLDYDENKVADTVYNKVLKSINLALEKPKEVNQSAENHSTGNNQTNMS